MRICKHTPDHNLYEWLELSYSEIRPLFGNPKWFCRARVKRKYDSLLYKGDINNILIYCYADNKFTAVKTVISLIEKQHEHISDILR